MARIGFDKRREDNFEKLLGTATLFFPIVFDSFYDIVPQITMTALSAIAQSGSFLPNFSILFYLIADVVGTYY